MRAPEKKGSEEIDHGYLDWALAEFSGYLAVDELYDGPFCVLSAVDSRQQRRLIFEVLDHEPTHDDIRRFLARLKAEIEARGKQVRGITTDGSALYPVPIREIFGDIPHQICEFHILKELTKAVLKVVAKVRKRLKAQIPKLPRGRPKQTAAQQRQHRQAKRLKQRVAELFDNRYLFVRHHLTPAEQKILKRLVRGQPQLRALRNLHRHARVRARDAVLQPVRLPLGTAPVPAAARAAGAVSKDWRK